MTTKESFQQLKSQLELAIESYVRLPYTAQHQPASNADIYAVLCIIENLISLLEKKIK